MKAQFLFTITCLLFFSLSVTAQEKETIVEDYAHVSPPKNTTISFAAPTFEFGKIDQGEIVKNVFVITNTGSEILVISDAKGSCGCTVPVWPQDPLLPGESAEIFVEFNSKGKSGRQSKRVTITANTEPAQTFLTIKGEVALPDATLETKPVIVNKKVNANTFEVFPNPSSDQININLKDHMGQEASINIYNEAGQLMSSKEVAEISKAVITLDVANYAAGIYTVTMKVGDNMRVAKQIAVQH